MYGAPAPGRVGHRSLYFAAVNAEFNWWLLIVGLVVGAGLVWFVLMDARRREEDIDAAEHRREVAWLSTTMIDEGWPVPPEAAARLLELHRAYLEAPPPDPVPLDEAAPDDGPLSLQADAPGAAGSPARDAQPTTEREHRPWRPRRPRSTGSEGAGEDGVDLGA